jgi:hypothetical protein
LQRITEAAARLSSFTEAAYALQLAGVTISSRHVQRIAAEIGAELTTRRDAQAAAYRRRELPARVAAPPEVVAVEVDGGHLRTRAVGCGPGVHQQQNQEDKLACLVHLDSSVHAHDPQPEPPPSFLQPRRVQRLVQQMKGQAGDPPQGEAEQEDTSASGPAAAAPQAAPARPQRRLRTCVASMAESHTFGLLVAAEAQTRDFFRAARGAFLGDGAAYNWWIQRAYFPHFEPITDFLHLLCYLYLAAWGVGSDEAERWALYVHWLRACWQGRLPEVLADFRVWQGRIGRPPPEAEETNDPRQLLAAAVSYLENNQEHMDYPRYRQQGLPVTSSLVESLVGEFNARVKGREKFWNRPEGAEAILQVRAALLSEDDRLERHFAQRPGCPYRRKAA